MRALINRVARLEAAQTMPASNLLLVFKLAGETDEQAIDRTRLASGEAPDRLKSRPPCLVIIS